jgi:hypothetical protein
MHPKYTFYAVRIHKEISVKSAVFSSTVDVRVLEPRFRHSHIFSTFAALDDGHAIELLNDHDPLPLYAQFQAQWPNGIAWLMRAAIAAADAAAPRRRAPPSRTQGMS